MYFLSKFIYSLCLIECAPVASPCTVVHVAGADPNHACLHYDDLIRNESAGSACPINGQTTRALSECRILQPPRKRERLKHHNGQPSLFNEGSYLCGIALAYVLDRIVFNLKTEPAILDLFFPQREVEPHSHFRRTEI